MRILRSQHTGAPRSLVRGLLAALTLPSPAMAGTDPTVPVAVTYDTPGSLDEDDMCYWVHPTDPALSTVIVTDKFAGKIFVYDLDGSLLQELPSPSPRNVDTRYSVPFQRTCIDVVALTDRTEDIIRVYSVDRATRMLARIDDGLIYTHDNYGFTLYQHTDGQLYGLTGDRNSGLMRQFALFENGVGQMSGFETSWTFQQTRVEGVVADDETGYYYLAEESVGIWRVGVFDHLDRTLIATIGDATGLDGDVEGLGLYYAAGGEGYIVASSQGANKFTVIDRKPPHVGRGNFRVEGVTATDGLDVVNMSLNATYSKGIFTVHDGGSNCCSVHGVKWEDVANALGLVMDTDYWDPRIPCERLRNAVAFEEVESGGSLGSATVATAGNLSAVGGDLYVASVSTRGQAVHVQSLSGLGLSWRFLASQCSGRGLSSIETWTAQGNPSGNGVVTATLSSVPLAAVIAVNRYSNVRGDPVRHVVTANTNGLAGTCSGSSDSSTYALDVPTTVAGSFIHGAVTMRHHTHAPAERYRERLEQHAGFSGDCASVAVVDRLVTVPGTILLKGSFGSPADWAAIGFEILPAKDTQREYGHGPLSLTDTALPLSSGGQLTLDVSGAAPNSAGLLLVSPASADIRLGASARLYVAPQFVLQLPLAFDGRGRASLSASLPPSMSAGDVVLQAFAFASKLEPSNGLRVSISGARPRSAGRALRPALMDPWATFLGGSSPSAPSRVARQ